MTTTFQTRACGVLTALALGVLVAPAAPTAASPGRGAQHASAVLRDQSGAIIGAASFLEDGTGRVHVTVSAAGLTAGLHGLHIHAVGACVAPFASAGGHHNPTGATHGGHAGDLPNLEVDDAGRAKLHARTTAATLSPGPISVFDADGSTLVIHAGPDDLVTDPTGNSGARVACGVIEPR